MNDKKTSWEKIVYGLVGLIFGILLGFVSSLVYIGVKSNSQANIIEISNKIKDNVKDSKLDSLAIVKLENEIRLVERKNDGRFEVLTWSAGLLVAILVVLMGVNFISSNAKAEDSARDEIDRKAADFKDKMTEELNKVKEFVSGFDDLRLKAESDFQSIIELKSTLENLINNSTDDKDTK